MQTCEMCGRALRPTERGRPRQYCSRACRTRAYRARLADRPTGEIRGQARPVPENAEAVLDQDLIVRTAITLADRENAAAVSMRRIALDLRIRAMSLYRYVSSREELNDLMVDAVFDARPLPEPGPDGWLIIAGLWTEICVAMPAIQAVGEGYDVFVVTDASGGVTAEAHDMAVRRMEQAGVVPITWMAVSGEWQRDWARESTTDALAQIVQEHGGASGIAFAWEMQLLATPTTDGAGV